MSRPMISPLRTKNTCTHASCSCRASPKTSMSVRSRTSITWRSVVRSIACTWSRRRAARSNSRLLGRPLHIAAQVARDLVRAPFQEHDRLADHAVVLVLRAERGARPDAAVDEVLEARPRVLARDLLRAGAPREQLLDQVEAAPHRPGRGKRPEVADAVRRRHPPRDLDAGPLLPQVDLQVGVVLVVLQPHVEERLVPLDQRRLQQQRLLRRRREDELDVSDPLDELARLRLERVRGAEVGAHAVAQHRRLPDVQDRALRVLKDVNAGLRRHRAQTPPQTSPVAAFLRARGRITFILPPSRALTPVHTVGIDPPPLTEGKASSLSGPGT